MFSPNPVPNIATDTRYATVPIHYLAGPPPTGRGRVELYQAPHQASVVGALPLEVILRVVQQNRSQIRYCYEVGLHRDRTLEGKVSMKWIIGREGRVVRVTVTRSTLRDGKVLSCIKQKIRQWRFPAPPGGGIVEVNYPVILRSS